MEMPIRLVLSFALPSFAFGIYFFHRASRQGRFMALMFLAIILYGILLETMDIRTAHSYWYQRILVMIGRYPEWVPLSVCVSWASITWLCMRTSDLLDLPWLQRPLVDGVLAVSIDLVTDPVASASRWVTSLSQLCLEGPPTFGGIGYWIWCVPETNDSGMWMNVPTANFFGWFVVVFAASLLIRTARHKLGADDRPVWQQLLIIAGVIGLSLFAVFTTIRLYEVAVSGPVAHWAVLCALFAAPAVLIFAQRKRLSFDNPVDRGVVLMPVFSYVGSLYTFFKQGMDRGEWPTAAVLIVAAALGSCLLLFSPYLGRFMPGGKARATVQSP